MILYLSYQDCPQVQEITIEPDLLRKLLKIYALMHKDKDKFIQAQKDIISLITVIENIFENADDEFLLQIEEYYCSKSRKRFSLFLCKVSWM